MTEAALAGLVEMLLGAATIVVLLWVVVPDVRPWGLIARSARRTLRSRPRQLYFAAFLLILLFNYLYLVFGIDEHMTGWIESWHGDDFTRSLPHRVEGNAVARIQGLVACAPLTYYLGYVYVVVYPCLVFLAILVFDHFGDRRHLAVLLLAYVLCFAICLPFFLFVPVLECFVFYGRHPELHPGTRLLLDDISPAVMKGYRTMSGVDNCFPSFHTALAVMVALVARAAGEARFARLAVFLAVSTVISTFYLGVHWLTDVGAGIVVGWGAFRLARLLWDRWGNGQGVSRDGQGACGLEEPGMEAGRG